MSEKLTRRTFFGVASATLLATVGQGSEAESQNSPGWSLDYEFVLFPEPEGFALAVNYAVTLSPNQPLFVQVADPSDPNLSSNWEPITGDTGQALFSIGPYDVPDEHDYLISIVLIDGQIHPLSPIIPVTIQVAADRP
jgi:hypothetical protein